MSNKLREALSKASVALSWATHSHLTEDDAKECLEVVDAALSEPIRNSEVGTAEEQALRFISETCQEKYLAGECDQNCVPCFARWAQMPYKKEGEE